MPTIVAVILARGGSKGIPLKNIALLNNKPLLYYAINAAKNSKIIDEVYVSTDNKRIASVAKIYDAKVIDRPVELATDTSSSEEGLLHFIEQVPCDILVFMQCTSPLTTTQDLNKAIMHYVKKKYNSMFSACLDHGGFLCGGFSWSDKAKPINHELEKRKMRQERGTIYRENGAFYIMRPKGLKESRSRFHGKLGIYKMPSSRSYEIDSKDDLLFLDKLMKVGL